MYVTLYTSNTFGEELDACISSEYRVKYRSEVSPYPSSSDLDAITAHNSLSFNWFKLIYVLRSSFLQVLLISASPGIL